MKYINRFPLEVTAYEVIEAELPAVAKWCGGDVMVDADGVEFISVEGLAIYPDCMLAKEDEILHVIDNEIFDHVYEKI